MEALITSLLDAGLKGKLPKTQGVVQKPQLAKLITNNLTKALVDNSPAATTRVAVKARTRRRGRRQTSSGSTEIAPVAIGTRKQNILPKVTTNPRGRSYRIQKSEMVSSVLGSINFAQQSWPINPGLENSFPWLHAIAQQWEQYKFHSLTYQYVTRTNTSEKGSVILAPDYDANDGAPTSEEQVTTYQDAKEEVPWTDNAIRLDRKAMFPTGDRKFVRRGLVPFSDSRLYDAGTFYVCTLGQAADNTVLGKLWVHYDVEFFVPSVSSEENPDLSKQTSVFPVTPFTTSTSSSTNFGFEAPITNPLAVEQGSPTTLVLPKGAYTVNLVGSITTSSVPGCHGASTLKCYNDATLQLPAYESHRTVGANDSDQSAVNCEWLFLSDGVKPLRLQIVALFAPGTGTISVPDAQVFIQPA